MAQGAGRLTEKGLGIDAGLLSRFRAAAPKISWRDAPRGRPQKTGTVNRARIAHLNDEEARIEDFEERGVATWTVESGPVGALVLLLEIDRRGIPSSLTSLDAVVPGDFPHGAIRAEWGGTVAPPSLRLADLVGLARYALA